MSDTGAFSDSGEAFTPPLPDALWFDDGDVILRAGITDFKVHIVLLRLASPVFHSMFSLPQPHTENELKAFAPTIEMNEDPWALDAVLRWIYPLRDRPMIISIEKAISMLVLAEKFDVGCAVEAARDSLSHYLAIEPDPVRSWAIALRYGHEEARRASVKRFVKSSSSAVGRSNELAYVDGLQYFDLLDTRMKAWKAAEEIMEGVHRYCGGTCGMKESYDGLVKSRNPFLGDVSSDDLFQLAVTLSECSQCQKIFHSSKPRTGRQRFRARLAEILDNID